MEDTHPEVEHLFEGAVLLTSGLRMGDILERINGTNEKHIK